MSFMESIQAAINEAAEQTNMNEAQKGGGDGPRLPDAGLTRLRFISYIELGTHEDEWQGQKKRKKLVKLQFELSGPKHPPLELEDGRKIPLVITITENISLNEKANFYKLFKRMNHTGQFTHMAQMLGSEFLGTVVHVSKGEGADKKTYANLRDDGGYTIRPPYVEDPETGESRKIEVQPPLTPLRCFLFANATKDMWDSIFIDGTWDPKKNDKGEVISEGRSKNIYQEQIKAALDFAGSPISDILFGELDLPNAEKPERTEEGKAGAAADPLEGVA